MARKVSWVAVAAAFLLPVTAVPAELMGTWMPPPPELADFTGFIGVDAYVHKWDPSLGEPTSLLDVLPAGSPAVGDFNRDSAPDLFIPLPGYTDETLQQARAPISRLYLNDWTDVAQKRLVEVTDVSGIEVDRYAYSASWGDVDGDGYVDLFVGGYRVAKLFRNDGDGTFTDITDDAGLAQDGFTLGSAWGDFDNDGDLDLALAQFAEYEHPDDGLPADDFSDLPGRANVLLRNNGDDTFTDVGAGAGLSAIARRSTTVSFVDVDRDGLVDLFFTNYGEPAEAWRNVGDGTFMEIASAAGISDGAGATCQIWEDLDLDGDLDLYVAHEAGVRDGLWLGNGAGTYTDVASTIAGLEVTEAGRGWGCTPFDHDGDAAMDLFVARAELQGEMAQLPTLLTNTFHDSGVVGFLDNLATAGDGLPVDYAGFENIATPRAASGAVAYDFDLNAHAPGAGKGAPDLATVNGDGGSVRMFLNGGWHGGWKDGNGDGLYVRLRGVASNSLGIGAQVTVTAGSLSSTREMGAGSTWGTALPTDALLFGLAKPESFGYATSSRSVSVRIEWPSGQVDNHANEFFSADGAVFTEGQGFLRDFAPPNPSFLLDDGTEGRAGWYTSEHVDLRLIAQDLARGGSDISGVSRVEWSRDGVAWTAVPCVVSSCFANTGAIVGFDGEGTHNLWVRATDRAGNSAVTLYPIRIDTTPPEPGIVSPVHGSAYVQGREVLALGDASPLARAIVVKPVALDPADAAPELGPVGDLVGSDGTQPIVVEPFEEGSGIARVDIVVKRANGEVIDGMSRSFLVPPYEYAWPVGELPSTTYRVEVNVTDGAGHWSLEATDVLVLGPVPPEPPSFEPDTVLCKVSRLPTCMRLVGPAPPGSAVGARAWEA